MSPRHGHLAFAAASALCLAVAATGALQWQAAVRANAATALAARIASEDPKAPLPPEAEGVPEAALARALAIAHRDEASYEAALHAYDAIAQTPREDLRLVIRYDLGNLHLREALRIEDEELAKSRTFTELAKQNYRHVLEQAPQHWAARYNLERALWLVPEKDEPAQETSTPPPSQRPNGDKPDLP